MPRRATDRIKALQLQRAAALAPQAPPQSLEDNTSADPTRTGASPAQEVDAVQAHFGGLLTTLVQNRQVQRIPIEQIATDTRPEMRQPRLLPALEELLLDGVPAPVYRDMLTELHTLGQSLKTQQIQPIVVYPGTNSGAPAARYLLLVGQRRWTAARLVGIEALDAIVVDPPTPADRIRIQYAENEDREEFSDMERAWSLQQLKHAMDDAPWEVIEERLHLSRSRRHQLIRLLTFSPPQQRLVAQLRLQETQVRPLHTSLRNQELTSAQADTILQRLAELVAQRTLPPPLPDTLPSPLSAAPAAPLPSSPAEIDTAASATRRGVDGPTIARLVARTQRASVVTTTMPPPRWVAPFHEQITRMRQALGRTPGRIALLNDQERTTLTAALHALRDDLDQVIAELDDQQSYTDDAM